MFLHPHHHPRPGLLLQNILGHEKKAVVKEIKRHIASLDPHVQFLKHEGRGPQSAHGDQEDVTQATYAHSVAVHTYIKVMAADLVMSGLVLKDRAASTAKECNMEASTCIHEAMEQVAMPKETIPETALMPTHYSDWFSMSGVD